MASLRTTLQQCTAEAHSRLEETPTMQAMASGAPSDRTYAAYLVQQWRLHAGLEPALVPWVPEDWVALRLVKRAWLLSDLATMGVAPAGVPPTPVHIPSQAYAFGALYVLEGSTLGLRVIEKRLPAWHPALTTASRFVRGYGVDTGLHWRNFLVRLEQLPPPAWPTAVRGALATFELFLDAFSSDPGSNEALDPPERDSVRVGATG